MIYCLYLVGDQDYFLYEIAPLFYFLAKLRGYVKFLESLPSGTGGWGGLYERELLLPFQFLMALLYLLFFFLYYSIFCISRNLFIFV